MNYFYTGNYAAAYILQHDSRRGFYPVVESKTTMTVGKLGTRANAQVQLYKMIKKYENKSSL